MIKNIIARFILYIAHTEQWSCLLAYKIITLVYNIIQLKKMTNATLCSLVGLFWQKHFNVKFRGEGNLPLFKKILFFQMQKQRLTMERFYFIYITYN